MRTLVDIPDDDVKWLDRKAAANGRSRAALLREAVSAYRAEHAKSGLELGFGLWKDRTDIGDADYLGMVLQKTCWLGTIHPLRVGCLIGMRGRLPLEPLIRLGFFFGAAFQIQDDILNLEPGPDYGKEINGDLFEGKRTLMIIHALRQLTGRECQRMVRFLGSDRAHRSARDVDWMRSVIQRTGALEHAKTVARSLAGAALHEFDELFARTAPSRDLAFLRAVLTWVLRRSR
jgi:geranylgeranyl diphosphate synthase type II